MFSLGTLRSEVLVAEMEVRLSGIKDTRAVKKRR